MNEKKSFIIALDKGLFSMEVIFLGNRKLYFRACALFAPRVFVVAHGKANYGNGKR
jgi:hypothetical protein